MEQDAERERRRKADEFVRHVHERFKVMKPAEDLQRRRSVEEVEFNSGKHWDDDLRKERDDNDQVIIEINRTPQFLNQVANEQRMTRPSINIKPAGSGADEAKARVMDGMIRSIQLKSSAEAIRDDAFYAGLEKGWSYYRVNVPFESDRSFRQVVRTGRIANDFAVYCDPAAREYDKSDAADYIITDDIPVDTYKEEYADSEMASMTNFVSVGDTVK